ncbi:helix-turn-helix domain-containing protein [Actinoplanes sp. NPDC026623]|uniref:helix-turn-helix domain-containing protein n=1 Tax=Actinoplanes sp. NPDC026623 TaxID=3155610 RepID=UPI0033FEF7F5
MTVNNICQRLKVSRWTVQRAIKNKHLEAVKVRTGRGGSCGQWRIPEESFQEWVNSGTHAEPQAGAGAGTQR